MRIYILLLSFVAISCGCATQDRIDAKRLNPNSDKLGKIVGEKYLLISASFDECGEFGGHQEEFEIFKENETYYAKFTEHPVECNEEYPKYKLVIHEKFRLNEKNKKAVLKYLHKLLEKSLQVEVPYHAGHSYYAKISNTSFELHYHDYQSNWKSYQKLKKQLQQ